MKKEDAGPISFRADKWRRPWVLTTWPAFALAAPEIVGTDNPNILVADGLATFKAENGEATYKLGEPIRQGGPLLLELQATPASRYEPAPEAGKEPEPAPVIPDNTSLAALDDGKIMDLVLLHLGDSTGTRDGDIAALAAKRDGVQKQPEPTAEPPAAEKSQDPAAAGDAFKGTAEQRHAEIENGDEYTGPDVGQEVFHAGHKQTVHATKHEKGVGSSVQFVVDGPYVPVSELSASR